MTSTNGIKAIFFDLDGTLRHSVPAGGDVFTDFVFTLGLPLKEEDRLRAMRWEHLYWANSVDYYKGLSIVGGIAGAPIELLINPIITDLIFVHQRGRLMAFSSIVGVVGGDLA